MTIRFGHCWNCESEIHQGICLTPLRYGLTPRDGFLVFSKSLIENLDLDQEAATEAILADGSRVLLESYVCYVDWFGEVVLAQVIANEGKLPLLGTEFLASRRLLQSQRYVKLKSFTSNSSSQRMSGVDSILAQMSRPLLPCFASLAYQANFK